MLTDQPAIEVQAAESGAFVFRDEAILGTRMQLMLVAQSFALAREAACAVRAEIDRLEAILSGWRPDSELSILNRSRVHRASLELFEVVRAAEHWFAASAGAFNGRLGRIFELWQRASVREPNAETLQRAADQAAARIELHADTRTIIRPSGVRFALDGVAKGWIVDRAYAIARSLSGVNGALVDIGGDIRCGGDAPNSDGWLVGLADPLRPFDNAPTIATLTLKEGAVATSGRGPRDRVIAGTRVSPTVVPASGQPIVHHVAASVIASSAAAADALATAMLVMPTQRALALADEHGAAVRIVIAGEAGQPSKTVQNSAGQMRFSATDSASVTPVQSTPQWQEGWQALATFTAPRRQLIRDPQFRSPYVAMWITDRDNRPIRTLLLVGKRADWQKDNFIWWSMNRAGTERLVATRSMSTSAAGVYNVFWDGVDDAGAVVPAGTYVLHVETSRERGKHTYRSLTLDFATFRRFAETLAPTEEGGGLRVSFDRY